MRNNTLKESSHTHPHTGESFGEAVAYRRGPVVAADGGSARAESASPDPDDSEQTLGEIDHTPPYGPDDGVARNRVYERGRSGV